MQQDKLIIRQAGIQPYCDVINAMQNFTHSRTPDTPDEVWLVQHPAVYTQGQTGKPENLLTQTDIPVIQSNRGGQITYHGPGQQIMYVMINLRRQKISVRRLVSVLEDAVVQSLKEFNIPSYARNDAPGVYVDREKICSLGLRIQKGCSFHGLALNVDMDLTPFKHINPCGYPGLTMTQVKTFAPAVTMAEIQSALVQNFAQILNYQHTEFRRWRMTDYD